MFKTELYSMIYLLIPLATLIMQNYTFGGKPPDITVVCDVRKITHNSFYTHFISHISGTGKGKKMNGLAQEWVDLNSKVIWIFDSEISNRARTLGIGRKTIVASHLLLPYLVISGSNGEPWLEGNVVENNEYNIRLEIPWRWGYQ